jgi:hypothetical protein
MNRETIAKRLEAQRNRIWQVQGICGLASAAAHSQASGEGKFDFAGFATDVWTALEGASEILNEIAGALESDVLLKAAGEESGEETGS